jgi:hypothetical protein
MLFLQTIFLVALTASVGVGVTPVANEVIDENPVVAIADSDRIEIADLAALLIEAPCLPRVVCEWAPGWLCHFEGGPYLPNYCNQGSGPNPFEPICVLPEPT